MTLCSRGPFGGSARRGSVSIVGSCRGHACQANCMSLFEKRLTRRANHRHIFIIARITKARAGKPAAGFLFAIFESGFLNRTAAALHGRTISPSSVSRKDAPQAALPSELLSTLPVRANAPARGVDKVRVRTRPLLQRQGSRLK